MGAKLTAILEVARGILLATALTVVLVPVCVIASIVSPDQPRNSR